MKVKSMRVDLHVHSSASDGIFSPAAVVELSARAGLKAVGLTDHDTIGGLEEAAAAGLRCGIEVVPGVELSVNTPKGEIHLLGYYPHLLDRLEQFLSEMRRERRRRIAVMLQRLHHLGMDISPEEVAWEAGEAAPGRLHLARLLVKKRYVKDLKQAFAMFLERGKPAYVPRNTLDPEQALRVLKRAEAVPVLAHPGQSGFSLLRELAPLGLRGVEAFHPEHSELLRQQYCRLADEMGLLVTGGSDFHGDGRYRADRPGAVSVEYRHLERLKEESFAVRRRGRRRIAARNENARRP